MKDRGDKKIKDILNVMESLPRIPIAKDSEHYRNLPKFMAETIDSTK